MSNNRWPPMLGVVGFDGGHKPAIALSIPPRKPVAGEDVSGGGGEGTGACCYDDGTCDSPITQFDCTSAGGTYQGDGTDCDSVTCTGVCCEPGCVDDSTPDSCTADGGTWQGFGTTCADDPPPCLAPCGGCGFAACDGSGRTFLTRTTTTHIVKIQSCLDSDPTLTCENGIDGTQVITDAYDPADCSFTSNVDRSGDWSLIGGFETLTFHRCDGTTGHTDPISCGTMCMSATEEFCSSETDFNHPTCTPVDTSLIVTIDVVLSDECDPDGMSPPP